MVGQTEDKVKVYEIRTGEGQVPATPTGSIEEAAQRIIQLDAEARKYAMGARRGVEEALALATQCGDWLLYAKSKVKHGDWLPWLHGIGVQQRTAHRYMALANQTDRSNLLAARNITHAMELAGVRKPETTKADQQDRSSKVRLPDTIERIGVDFARWKANDFDKRIDTASDALLCAWEKELKPMAQAYEMVCERLRK